METVLTDENFDSEVLASELPVIVDFWAEWCGPCKMMRPVFEQMAGKYSDKIKFCSLNVDESAGIPAKFGIRGIPTFLFFKEGKVVKTVVGSMPPAEFEEKIKQEI
ncbi:MAG TPA: thioredoxin [Lachnospiraceae bacterium]|nr:thioredoxin [Lachnospiraceae bacterium]